MRIQVYCVVKRRMGAEKGRFHVCNVYVNQNTAATKAAAMTRIEHEQGLVMNDYWVVGGLLDVRWD